MLRAMQRMMCMGAILVVAACGGAPHVESPTASNAPPVASAPQERASSDPGVSQPLEEGAPSVPDAPSCDARLDALDWARQAVVAAAQSCRFSVDCAMVMAAPECAPGCPSSVHVRERGTVTEHLASVDAEQCEAIQAAGCERGSPECAEKPVAVCRAGRCVIANGDPELDDISVPEANRAGLPEPPSRPDVGDAEERAARLLSAIVHNDPSLAADFFFPQEAFRKVKAIPNPDRYWRKLFARYQVDIHALHEALGADESVQIEFERLEIVRRGGFVRRREEGNALPYWAARHNWLHFTRNGNPDKLEVRVLISWGERWYITHLSEFR